MSSPGSIARWPKFVIAGITICLLAFLLHPAPALGSLLAAFVLIPVLLFGLVLVPCSLWPSRDLDQRFALAVCCRTNLFQRPPPTH